MDFYEKLKMTEDAPVIKEITGVMCNKTQNQDTQFYKTEVAYFLAKMASSMRVWINTRDRGKVPVNIYALCLANSGFGKGFSVSIMENEFINGFKKKFVTETMLEIADHHLDLLAQDRALKKGTDESVEKDALITEYKKLGMYPFTFDSGTAPAVKQLRDKLLLANCGSINLQIDEIGSNLIGSTEVLNIFLELYDLGMVKQKLVKNTVDNTRAEDRDGSTPTNMLLFGTPVKLFDGGMTEDAFYSFLEIGYARRCLFGIGKINKRSMYTLEPEEIFRRLTDPSNQSIIDKWRNHFINLADSTKFNWQLQISNEVSIELIRYKCHCERIADNLPEHEEIKKAEISHRYFKALKLAGVFAFIDESMEVTELHLLQAIKLVEESGKAFETILTREKSYMRLAKFIASAGMELTHADLTEKLPFYKSSAASRNEMMSLAIAWGYKNHIIIKKTQMDGIEFFKGETLKVTDLNKIIVSYSTELAYNYMFEEAPWDQLKILFTKAGYSWCNHAFKNNHRCNDEVIPGFNIVVVDVDGTTSLTIVQELFRDYKYIIYTTKRHGQDGKDRFRLIFPMNYVLQLNIDDYKTFMNNVFKWLPFSTDECANQPSKKWLANDNCQYFIHEGILLDALKFIPRTRRNEEYLKEISKISNLGNLERWFLSRVEPGNRNNMLFKYGMVLVDSGLSLEEVKAKIKYFNKQFAEPLSVSEINSSILTTIAKKYE